MAREVVEDTRPQPAIVIPKPLPTWKVVMLSLLLPVTVVMAIVATAGLWALSDQEKTAWISQTPFAQHYRSLIEWNPFFSAFFFNGGIFGTFFIVHQLRKHSQAKLLKGVKFINAKEAVKQARKKQK